MTLQFFENHIHCQEYDKNIYPNMHYYNVAMTHNRKFSYNYVDIQGNITTNIHNILIHSHQYRYGDNTSLYYGNYKFKDYVNNSHCDYLQRDNNFNPILTYHHVHYHYYYKMSGNTEFKVSQIHDVKNKFSHTFGNQQFVHQIIIHRHYHYIPTDRKHICYTCESKYKYTDYSLHTNCHKNIYIDKNLEFGPWQKRLENCKFQLSNSYQIAKTIDPDFISYEIKHLKIRLFLRMWKIYKDMPDTVQIHFLTELLPFANKINWITMSRVYDPYDKEFNMLFGDRINKEFAKEYNLRINKNLNS